MRSVESFRARGANSLLEWHRVRNPIRVALNFAVIYLCRYLPSLRAKNVLYRLIGMKVGKGAAVGLGVTFDIFFPELIELGEGCLIGYDSAILTHEFLIGEWRKGKVKVGKNVLIGARVLILPGVTIGDGAVVSSCSLVNKDVEKGAFVGGIPAKPLR